MKKVYALRFVLGLVLLGTGVNGQVDSQQTKTLSDIVQEKQLNNARRATESGIGESLSGEEQEIGRALREYRETQSIESLSIIKKVLEPGSDSTMVFATLKRLPLNEDTYSILLEFIPKDGSMYRWFAVDKLKFAPAALRMDETQIAELLDFLNDITENTNSSDFRVARTAQMVLKQLKETPYIEMTQSRSSRIQDIKAFEEPIVEVLPIPLVVKSAEEATAPEPVAEKPSEAETPEPSEELAEQPAQWWLWLIGAVIVVGGLAVALRHKS